MKFVFLFQLFCKRFRAYLPPHLQYTWCEKVNQLEEQLHYLLYSDTKGSTAAGAGIDVYFHTRLRTAHNSIAINKLDVYHCALRLLSGSLLWLCSTIRHLFILVGTRPGLFNCFIPRLCLLGASIAFRSYVCQLGCQLYIVLDFIYNIFVLREIAIIVFVLHSLQHIVYRGCCCIVQ